jgi:chorismate dehydratase
MLTLGCIDYVNSLPLFYALINNIVPINANFLFGPPTYINQKFFDNQIDVSLVSSVFYLKNTEHLSLIKPFGISAKGAVKSVFLYKKVNEPKTIALTDESATSVELLKILCKEKWCINPLFFKDKNIESYDAFLIIGDKALKESYPEYDVLDLSLEWYNHFQYPFAFALMVTRKNQNKDNIGYLTNKLEESLNWAESNINAIIEVASQKLFLPKIQLEEYFKLLNYRLDHIDFQGLELFNKYLQEKSYV